MEESAIVKRNAVILDALVKMGLSAAATVCLLIFGAAEKYGWPQMLGLLFLHAVGLMLLGSSLKTGERDLAITALALGVLWNLGAILWLISQSGSSFGPNGWEERPVPTTDVVGATILIYWFGGSIRKLAKTS